MKGASTLVAAELQRVFFYATEVAAPIVSEASTLVVEKYNVSTICATKVAPAAFVFYATEVASPKNLGASTLVDDKSWL